jgi:hypothetical protein
MLSRLWRKCLSELFYAINDLPSLIQLAVCRYTDRITLRETREWTEYFIIHCLYGLIIHSDDAHMVLIKKATTSDLIVLLKKLEKKAWARDWQEKQFRERLPHILAAAKEPSR